MANKIALIVGPGHAGLGQAMAQQLGGAGVYDCAYGAAGGAIGGAGQNLGR
ncbi:hypothetical protein [Schleiferilactobacillus harbinensis]|uniref:hypothetical protein n=1 Tax=Schleiferilactobacillus harbinensis TaxID=304207 RepID=UPI0021A60946|nr:hypothetical protein [Schleiferilactobacillus harbinensis]